MSIRRKVAYFHDPDIGSYYYGSGHPMKPQRIRMTHSLIVSYNLYKYMEVYRPHKSDVNEMTLFHDPEYVDFLASINADNYREFSNQLKRFNVGEATDCPVFEGLFQFQQSCAGASIDGASKLNHHIADICVNWSGGLHHAKMAEASGFCYINDIVLGILELLKYYARVMYIDIDVHHGDGVEEAFYVTHRVMTVSFHKFGDFFPGTGDITDIGIRKGKYYSVNVPLNDGITDEAFVDLFKTVVGKCVECYRPGAIIIQCGADSLTGDRLGRFNLTIKGHAKCVEHVRSYNIPLLVLGGGGYTIRNVARCWTYETGVVLNKHQDMSDQIGLNDYYDYYAPDFHLHLQPSNMPNYNSSDHLNTIKTKIIENLRHIEHAPGVQFSYVPPDFFNSDSDGRYEDHDEDTRERCMVRRRNTCRKIRIDECHSETEPIMPHLLRRKDYENDFLDFPDRDQQLIL